MRIIFSNANSDTRLQLLRAIYIPIYNYDDVMPRSILFPYVTNLVHDQLTLIIWCEYSALSPPSNLCSIGLFFFIFIFLIFPVSLRPTSFYTSSYVTDVYLPWKGDYIAANRWAEACTINYPLLTLCETCCLFVGFLNRCRLCFDLAWKPALMRTLVCLPSGLVAPLPGLLQ